MIVDPAPIRSSRMSRSSRLPREAMGARPKSSIRMRPFDLSLASISGPVSPRHRNLLEQMRQSPVPHREVGQDCGVADVADDLGLAASGGANEDYIAGIGDKGEARLGHSTSTSQELECPTNPGRFRSWHVPYKAGIYKARTRLGAEPVKELFVRVAKPLAQPGTPGALYRKWRLVAIDGTTLDVSDTPANLEHFKKPATTIGEAAYAKVRIAALAECGTHAIFGAVLGPYGVSEQTLVRDLLPFLAQGMLCIADRGVFGYELWEQARESGAELLWRAKSNYRIETVKELADGSYLGNVYHHRDRKRLNTLTVRVVEYPITEGEDPDNLYRLFTTILDPELAPASELAALYGTRWEIESAFDELKTHLNESRRVLRSQSPELVYQELWGMLALHYAIRALMYEVAVPSGRDPDRLSFVGSLRAERRSVAQGPGFSPSPAG